MEIFVYITFARSLLSIILLAAVLLKLRAADPHGQETRFALLESGLSELKTQLRDEFERSRRESGNHQKDMRAEMTDSLNAMNERLSLMTKANFEHQQQLTNTFSQSLETIRRNNIEQNDRQSRIIAESIEKMQQSNEKKLDEMRATVDEKLSSTLTTRLDSSFKTVSEQLENVYKSLGEMKILSTGVTENVTSLNRILTNVKARGTWAEVQLEGLLEQTIPSMFVKNYSPGAGREVVEFAVKIPSSDDKSSFTYLPIDSKFPVEDYIRLCSAADSGDAQGVEAARKALEMRVIAQARDVKKYINEPSTTPFAIMYLATEGLYSEIISSKNGIAERCQNEFRVMIAGPSTITALLNSLSVGFRAMAINEKAKEIRTLLAAAKMQYEKFGVVLEKARKKIDEAGKTLDDAQTRNDLIQKKLRSVEEIEQSEADKLLDID